MDSLKEPIATPRCAQVTARPETISSIVFKAGKPKKLT